MTARSQEATTKGKAFERGHRLYCPTCRSEVEIINPCTCPTPSLVLRCCGKDMKTEVGVSVNLDD